MPRTKPADERRADLLAAGQALFMTKGVTATTLDDVTSGAGVSKGLFYRYFRSKEDLVAALQERFSIEFAAHVRAAARTRPDWPGKLDAAVLACFEHFDAQHDLHEVLFRHPEHIHADHGDEPPAHRHLVGALAGLLADGTAAGALRVEDPETTALLFFAAMHAFDNTFGHAGELAKSRLVRATVLLVRRAAGVMEPPPQERPPAASARVPPLPASPTDPRVGPAAVGNTTLHRD